MNHAIAKLQYHLESETKAAKEYVIECNKLNNMFYAEGDDYNTLEEDQLQVIREYEDRIESYKKALNVLNNL